MNRQHVDRLVLAAGHKRQIAARVDGKPGRLLAHLDRGDMLRRVCGQADDIELVVRLRLPAGSLWHPLQRVRHNREPPVWRDAEICRWAENRVHER